VPVFIADVYNVPARFSTYAFLIRNSELSRSYQCILREEKVQPFQASSACPLCRLMNLVFDLPNNQEANRACRLLTYIGRNRPFSQGEAELLLCDWVSGHQERKCYCHDEVTPELRRASQTFLSQFDHTPAQKGTIVTKAGGETGAAAVRDITLSLAGRLRNKVTDFTSELRCELPRKILRTIEICNLSKNSTPDQSHVLGSSTDYCLTCTKETSPRTL
jgi:hypothetical protein